jgi:light-regulated signal transduction histidine kinase (bacteriophytochrome)
MAGEEQGSGSFELPGPILLAHELRSHLAAISLAATHLVRRLSDQIDDPHVAQSLKTIDNAARRAMELTSFVLASAPQPLPQPVAEPTHKPRSLHHVDVVQIVQDVVGDLSLLVPSRKVRVTAVDDCAGRGDDVRIRAVLTNVILTAARQTANGGAIDIHIERVAGNAHVTIATPDWQPGQPELDELLRPFANLESPITLDAKPGQFNSANNSPDAASSSVEAEADRAGQGVVVRLGLGPAAGRPRMPRQNAPSNHESQFQTP